MNEKNISEQIANCCIRKYLSFNKRFKPTNLNQWTILSGIVMEIQNEEEQYEPEIKQEKEQKKEYQYEQSIIKKEVEENHSKNEKFIYNIQNVPKHNLIGNLVCVALGTGLKCLGEKQRLSTGEIINDSHAEVLCRRAFMRYLYSEIHLALNEVTSIFKFNEKTGKFKMAENIIFHFYINQAPCGDASTYSLSENQTEQERIINENKKRKFEEENNSKKCIKMENDKEVKNENIIYRGRLNYNALGVLRTKPGRIDADPTLSMSCSDKIAKWTFLGITGSLLQLLLETPIYLNSISVEEMFDRESMERALIGRFKKIPELPKPYRQVKPKIWNVKEAKFPFSKKQIELYIKKETNKKTMTSNFQELDCKKKNVNNSNDKDRNLSKNKSNEQNYNIYSNSNGNSNNNNNRKLKKCEIKADDKAMNWSYNMGLPEVVINGRKQGASPKNGTYNKKKWSELCKYNLFEQFIMCMNQLLIERSKNDPKALTYHQLNQLTYQQCKDMSKKYVESRNILYFGNSEGDNNNNCNDLNSELNSGIFKGWRVKPSGYQDFKIS